MGEEKTTRESESESDPRVEGIATVGWVTLAALGISIPLSAIGGAFTGWLAAALPLTIILGAGIMSMRIWSSGEKLVNEKENEALKDRIQDLEERLANLEMVDSLEAHFAEKHRHPQEEGPLVEGTSVMGPAREETSG